MNILIVAIGSQGDVNPFIKIGIAFKREGMMLPFSQIIISEILFKMLAWILYLLAALKILIKWLMKLIPKIQLRPQK